MTRESVSDRLTDMRQTPLQQLVDLKLGGNLRGFVLARRTEGQDWRSIANTISQETGQSVSHESLRSWFSDEAAEPAAKGA